MLKELLFCGSALSSLGTPTMQRSHVVEDNGVAITYKYDTNEVSSVDDLIRGNIYHFSFEGITQISYTEYFTGYLVNVEKFFVGGDFTTDIDEVYFENDDNIELSSISFNFGSTGDYNFTLYSPSYTTYIATVTNLTFQDIISFEFDFLLIDFIIDSRNGLNSIINFISGCENIPIESVERVYPDNIFGFVSSFIDEHLLNGIPNIDNVVNTIGGQTITLRSWLNTSICIVLAVLLIVLLVWFVRYLFRLFSGLLH